MRQIRCLALVVKNAHCDGILQLLVAVGIGTPQTAFAERLRFATMQHLLVVTGVQHMVWNHGVQTGIFTGRGGATREDSYQRLVRTRLI